MNADELHRRAREEAARIAEVAHTEWQAMTNTLDLAGEEPDALPQDLEIGLRRLPDGGEALIVRVPDLDLVFMREPSSGVVLEIGPDEDDEPRVRAWSPGGEPVSQPAEIYARLL